MKILIIDNYDSFTYNLLHYMQDICSCIDVVRNDGLQLKDVSCYDGIILSPGPGLPEDAGICLDIIKTYYRTKKILGVCLGHQAIATAFGGRLQNLNEVMHGVTRTTNVLQPPDMLFKGLPPSFSCGRYHSWVVDRAALPDELEATSFDDNGFIMSLRHKSYDVRGVQFHPESVMTPCGKELLKNWVRG